jgi:hypothetical protein
MFGSARQVPRVYTPEQVMEIRTKQELERIEQENTINLQKCNRIVEKFNNILVHNPDPIKIDINYDKNKGAINCFKEEASKSGYKLYNVRYYDKTKHQIKKYVELSFTN